MKDSIFRLAAISTAAFLFSMPVKSEVLDEASLNVFQPNTTALAEEVNQNFEVLRDAVNELGARANEVSTISFPAAALGFDPDSTDLERTANAVNWQEMIEGDGIYINLQRPADYAGGDVTLTVYFQTPSGAPAGEIVDFGAQAHSYTPPTTVSMALILDPIRGEGVALPDTSGTLIRHFRGIQELTLPESRLTGSWWHLSLARMSDHSNTYEENLTVYGVSLEYPTVGEE